MPIRINLLAEQKAAEEMRRKDPVKRAIWIAGGIVALTILWSLNLQFKIAGSRSELGARQARWGEMEGEFLQVSNNFREVALLNGRMQSLKKYATNRFLWAPPLNALQYLGVDQVRLMKFEGVQTFIDQKQQVATTNLIVNLPKRSWWKFWGGGIETNLQARASEMLQSLTNRAEFQPFLSALKTDVSISTNRIQIVGKIQVIKPQTVAERIRMTIRARDYGHPAGVHVDPFYAAVTNAPYFRSYLNRTNSSVQPEAIQAAVDTTDPIRPEDPFMPFTIECTLPDRIRTNE